MSASGGLIQFSTDELFSQPLISSLKATFSLKKSFISNRPEFKRLEKFVTLTKTSGLGAEFFARLHIYCTSVQCSNLCTNSSPSRWRPCADGRRAPTRIRSALLAFTYLDLSWCRDLNNEQMYSKCEVWQKTQLPTQKLL